MVQVSKDKEYILQLLTGNWLYYLLVHYLLDVQ